MLALATLLAAACSEDSTSTSASNASSSATQGSGGAAQGSGGMAAGGTAAGGSGGMAEGGAGVGGIGPTGCVDDPDICPRGWECCTGVPYPPEGQCYAECNFESDRSAKHDLRHADGDLVLERLAALPIARWRYDASPEHVHMGPMAQDFRASFGLGDSDRHIAAVDASGVTMAALQALHRRVEALSSRSDALERDNHALRAEIASLRAARAESAASSDAVTRR
jgi:hypothetical protein